MLSVPEVRTSSDLGAQQVVLFCVRRKKKKKNYLEERARSRSAVAVAKGRTRAPPRSPCLHRLPTRPRSSCARDQPRLPIDLIRGSEGVARRAAAGVERFQRGRAPSPTTSVPATAFVA